MHDMHGDDCYLLDPCKYFNIFGPNIVYRFPNEALICSGYTDIDLYIVLLCVDV